MRSAERHQLAWWDALIVEAAALACCDSLLTEGFNAGQVIGGVEVVNPFRLELSDPMVAASTSTIAMPTAPR